MNFTENVRFDLQKNKNAAAIGKSGILENPISMKEHRMY